MRILENVGSVQLRWLHAMSGALDGDRLNCALVLCLGLFELVATCWALTWMVNQPAIF